MMQLIKRVLAQKDALIEDLQGLLDCFLKGAKADMKLKPSPAGPVYRVEIYDSKQKHSHYVTFGAQGASNLKDVLLGIQATCTLIHMLRAQPRFQFKPRRKQC